MLLKNKYANTRYSNLQEYYCDLTRELDSIIELPQDQHWKHYISFFNCTLQYPSV